MAQQARTLASHLDGREPRELLDDVRHFARRKPGMFLLGALAAGVVAGRLTRGAKAAQSDSGTTGSGTSYSPGTSNTFPVQPSSGPYDPTLAGTSGGTPLAGTGATSTSPAYPTDAASTDTRSDWTDVSDPDGDRR